MKRSDDQIDHFDPNKWNDETAEAVNKQIALQNGERAHRFVSHAAQREGNKRDNDERIENNGAEDCARGSAQVHDVERRDFGKCRH